jgi:3-dehydroquinate dehydratase-1
MNDPNLFYAHLYKAMQWGCEYIDVELWLPVEIRRALWERKGNSRIMSAFHDFTGTFKWPSAEAQQIFDESRKYSDIVKMISIISSMSENYELEYFRSTIKTNYPDGPLLSAVNMGPVGQLSRSFNTVFSPITHPLLPMVAAPGQLSAAQINSSLHSMGQLPKKNLYAIGTLQTPSQAMFFEKCINELGLPHQFAAVERGVEGSAEPFVLGPNFGGAYLNPPIAASQPYLPTLTDAARTIGTVDTIVAGAAPGGDHILVGDNAAWKGIRDTLTRDFVPNAYTGRTAIILSPSSDDAAAAIFALRSLSIGPIYAVGFKPPAGSLGAGVETFTSVESVSHVEQPFAIISAMPPEKSHLVQPLLRHFSSVTNGKAAKVAAGKVFVDLADGPRRSDPLAVAANTGWTAYGVADVGAWTTVATLKGLVGQRVQCDFVRM